MLKQIEVIKNKFLKAAEDKPVKIISHYDTDGITSAAILSRVLARLDKKFYVKIIKQFQPELIEEIDEAQVTIFLDLATNYLEELKDFENVFVIDHHEIPGKIPDNINFINPHQFDGQEISGAGLTYLFAKAIDQANKDLANLAVIGMIGDMLDKNVSKLNNQIINDAELVIKKGLLLYPATRPLNKALEYNSSFFIPGVTGNYKGAIEILREAGISKVDGRYKNLIEIDEKEMSNLITAIMLRRVGKKVEDIIGKIYLVKFFNKLEDARELSAMINACSRLGYSEVALSFCLGSKRALKKAGDIYVSYKQHIVEALNFVSQAEKIEGKDFIIINAKKKIKDTIIGTIASILSNSTNYNRGTVITTMAYAGDKIKVSSRLVGKDGRNVREILESVVEKLGGECGGHPFAAGCLIDKQKEEKFLKILQKKLEIELVKI